MTTINRREWGPVARFFSLIPVYLVLWPLFKIAELAGAWPQKILPRGMKKAFSWPQDFSPGERDVVLCSYFKSGTNWLMQIAVQVAWRGRAEFGHIHDIVPWPDRQVPTPFAINVNDVDPAQCPTGLRISKTHFKPSAIPLNDQARYICLVRDPKAVFASSYPFIRQCTLGPLMPTKKHWLDLFLSANAIYGPWPEHVADCWRLRHRPNVLFLTYEGLKEDLPGNCRAIAEFMGVDLNDAELDAVVRQAGFAHMKRISHKFDAVGVGPPWVNPRGGMIRKGENGGEELVAGCNARIDDYCRQSLQALGSDFPFDTCYGTNSSRS